MHYYLRLLDSNLGEWHKYERRWRSSRKKSRLLMIPFISILAVEDGAKLTRESLTSSSRPDNDQKIRSIALKIVPAKAKSIYSCPIQTRAALSLFRRMFF